MVRAPNWVGDLIMATPMLEAVVEAGRSGRFGRVSLVLRSHLAPLLSGGILADHLVPLERGVDEIEVLSALDADAALLLSNSFGAAWRAWRAGIGLRAGASTPGRRWLLTHRVVPPRRHGRRAVPTAHLLRDVTGLLGVATPSLHPHLVVDRAVAEGLRADLGDLGLGAAEPYAVCAPGAAFGAAKLWSPRRFAAVLDALWEERGLRGVVTGGPGEEPLIEAVAAAARHGALSLAGRPRDLEQLKALVAGAQVLLVGDSGPRWVAAAFDVPCVSVMGPNSPELTATSLEWCTVVRLEHLECSPCRERVCPLGHHRCMVDLPVEPVSGGGPRPPRPAQGGRRHAVKPRLLVRLPSWIGDAVMAEPSLRALRERYARAGAPDRLSIAASPALVPLLGEEGERPWLPPDDPRAWRGHDVALLFTGSFRSAWCAWRAGIPRRVGWARDGRGCLLTDRLSTAREGGAVPLGLGRSGRFPRTLPRPFGSTCVELLGLLGVPVGDTRPRLVPPREAGAAARAAAEACGLTWEGDRPEPFVLANVGARPGSAKGYPPEAWGRALGRVAAAAGVPVLAVGGPGEEGSIEAAVGAAGDPRVRAALPPCDLGVLQWLAAWAGVVASADAGPRHVAAAVGARVVCILGPTDPRHTADHLERTRLLRVEVPCGPCHLERCPLAGQDHHACMTGVAPERVAEAVLELLGG